MHARFARVSITATLLMACLSNGNRVAGAAPPFAPAAAAANAAPTFTVNSADDAPAGGVLTNGICETQAGNGVCTLRAAIMKANHFAGGGVTIQLPALPGGAAYLLTIPAATSFDGEASGDLNITGVMTITGGGAAGTLIDASGITPTTRVLSIQNGATAAISGVTLQGGNADAALDGGGIFVLQSTLTLQASTVTGNHAKFNGGGIENSEGDVTLDNVTVSNNSANTGGGLDNFGGRLDMVQSTVTSNTASSGGGIANVDYALRLLASTLSGNTASVSGGGLYNFSSLATAINSTIGNNISAGDGGGIYNNNTGGCCTVNLYNVSVVGNQAGPSNAGGGIDNLLTSTVTLRNTLLSINRLTSATFVPSDCSGTVTSQGYNLISSTAGCTVAGVTKGNLLEQFALLHPLRNNGGPTPTFAFFPDSPGIDGGNPAGCTGDSGALLTTDQRGAPRPANGAGATVCDIGAFELQRIVNLPLALR